MGIDLFHIRCVFSIFKIFVMTDFRNLVQTRRSHRKFTGEEIDADELRLILRAALMSPTSKGQRKWQFIVVDDRSDIEKLSDAKDYGSQFLRNAPVAVVVCGVPVEDDCWIEDGAIAAVAMQYQAEELGLGSCWVQIRGRGLSDGTDAELVVRGILDIPDGVRVLCVIGFGHKADLRKPQDEDKLRWENVHLDKY